MNATHAVKRDTGRDDNVERIDSWFDRNPHQRIRLRQRRRADARALGTENQHDARPREDGRRKFGQGRRGWRGRERGDAKAAGAEPPEHVRPVYRAGER
jgi:hypothetical protein